MTHNEINATSQHLQANPWPERVKRGHRLPETAVKAYRKGVRDMATAMKNLSNCSKQKET